ncbi:MAG: PDZ domain-containing protein, partial [Oscillospiraceae bacterium]|nr:PDZ domain-containing protein [Oscillospiraceae bacterium]
MKKGFYRAGFLILCFCALTMGVSAAQMLVPGGQVVGLELADNTVTVAAFDENLSAPAQQAGLKVGDRILTINGNAIHTAQDVRQAMLRSEGMVELKVQRGQKTAPIRFAPTITADGPKLGAYLKQGVTGVGTVTWYDPDTGNFGTLGHGVNNAKGELLKMVSGSAYRATVVSVRKGKCGEPGQLMGALKDANPIGTLYKNTDRGIFGKSETGWSGEPLPIAEAEDVHTGTATIRSTIQGERMQEYSVEILKVYANSDACGRNILLRITDS